ncbi:polysaccharide deacetylase family protein [Priestia megaterium]|uniref:polysaccharide deacetylase family protein n=1 Tax=Priestia megaterium TaxID=1404 RepID=UPI0009BD39B5|nr:polysaccharide deacetylase family protein [Priestia megaterium]
MKKIFKSKKIFYLLLTLTLGIALSFFVISEFKKSRQAISQSTVLNTNSLPLKAINPISHATKQIKILYRNMYVSNTLNDQNQALTQPIYLTFDDGPTPDTLKILEVLRQYNIKATFFMLKNQIDSYPTIAKKVAEEGHAIGCHGVSHDINIIYSKDGTANQEMQQCLATVKKVTGIDSKLIRVPYGSVPYLKEPHRTELMNNYRLWDWNIDSEDWALRSAPKIEHSIEPNIKRVYQNGQTPIILFHDKSFTAQSLPAILTYIKKTKYQPIEIDETMEPIQFPSSQ